MTQTARKIEPGGVERHPGKWVWFELVTPDARRAQAFYREVLGWKVQPFPRGGATYEMVSAGDTVIGGYTAPRRPDEPSRWISCASVEDVDDTLSEAVARGARVLEPAADVSGVGRRAALVDPFGVELVLFRNLMGDPPDLEAVTEGHWLWNELHVPDVAAALGFYGPVLGYQHRAFGPDQREPYTILSRDGVDRGGVTTAGCQGMPAHWLPYVRVQDVDGAAERVRRAGGQVRMLESIPGVGRIGIFNEPGGAGLALLSPRPAARS
ncbi:MAG TPA: VOC family protein [Myxococcaceae bacterium]|jgi:hypothetical protein